MNTPAHAIINLLIFKRYRKQFGLAIVFGALLPDAPMFVFYVWEKMQGVAEAVIWREAYHETAWQDVFNLFHSFPVLGLLVFLVWKLGYQRFAIFFASMFFHSLFDFPVHHNDAHAHFFPFSNYQFISPISYWNPAYHGVLIGLMEMMTVLFGSIYLWRKRESIVISRSVVLLGGGYLLFWLVAILIWM